MSIIIKDMKKIILLSVFIILSNALFSQEMKLYAPFPSRIKVETSGTEVIISWKDAKDVAEGRYEIYRAGIALTADNLMVAEKIGESDPGIQVYRDTPPVGSELFYAVFVKDSTQVYKICIPYRNVTTTAIKIEESDIEETKSSTISQLTAAVSDTEVKLNLQSSREEREIILFRNTTEINSYETLLKSIYITEKKGSSIEFTDDPMAGIDYYYAAVDGGLYRSGNENLLYEGNYTKTPIKVKFSYEVTTDALYVKSPMPLPLLKVTADLESGVLLNRQEIQETTGTISHKTLESVNRLIGRTYPGYSQVEAITLSYNRNINSIIATLFLNKKWSETVNQLEPYTSRNFDEETRFQSHFYRGQALYYLGKYNEALLEFIIIEKTFYVE
ncbi:MAG: hypothetical protein JEY91_18750, partial [Spirochaetaceae bacterium]|nr:hypothetical protein [Spirochaetaceae bacterium]